MMNTVPDNPAGELQCDAPAAQLRRRGFVLVADYPERAAFVERFKQVIVQAAADLHGADCAGRLERLGLHKLHECLPVEKSSLLRRKVLAVMRNEVLTAMVGIARQAAGLQHPFLLSDGLNLRVVYPFVEASKAPASVSNPHASSFAPDGLSSHPANWLAHRWKRWKYRLSLVRNEALRGNRHRQEIAEYNRGRPPATWSHGPHQDSRSGQARNNVNIWCAIAGVNRHSGMVLYPDHYPKNFRCDPVTAYISAGQRPGMPFKFAMRDGEVMVFTPEMLHSSHLNISDETRIVISARVNPGKPLFNTEPLRPERHWHRSTDILDGRFEKLVTAGQRLAEGDTEFVQAEPVECIELPGSSLGSGPVQVCAGSRIPENGRLRVRLADGEVLILRHDARLHAVSAKCPHVGIALEDGHVSGDRLYCPGHAVAFNLDSGRSSCSGLALRHYSVSEADGVISLSR